MARAAPPGRVGPDVSGMLPEQGVVRDPKHGVRSHFRDKGGAPPRPLIPVCHFCAKPLEKIVLAECKLCERMRSPAYADAVAFCEACAEDRRVARAPCLVNAEAIATLSRFYRHQPPIQSAVVPCPLKKAKESKCCDGERLMTMIYFDVPRTQEALNFAVNGKYLLREHLDSLTHYFISTFGENLEPAVTALCLLVLTVRGIAWRMAETEGSPRHFTAIAEKMLRTFRDRFDLMYRNTATEDRVELDLILSMVPAPAEIDRFLELAALLAGDDTIRLLLQGHHHRRHDRTLTHGSTLDATHAGERGYLSLPQATERLRDLARKAGLTPANVYALQMTIFQSELGHCSDLEHQSAFETERFAPIDTYMTVSTEFYRFLWGRAPMWNGSEFELEPEPKSLLDTLQYLVEVEPEPSADREATGRSTSDASPEPTWRDDESEGSSQGVQELLREIRRGKKLRSADLFVKPPGQDPVTKEQYDFLRGFVLYDAEVPGSRSFGKVRDPKARVEKLQHFLLEGGDVSQEVTPFIEALSDSPCADEVMHFVCRYFAAKYRFPTDHARSPQELLERCIQYMYACPISITFDGREWFSPSAPLPYAASDRTEYLHTFMLPQRLHRHEDLIGSPLSNEMEEAVALEERGRDLGARIEAHRMQSAPDEDLLGALEDELEEVQDELAKLGPSRQQRVREAYRWRREGIHAYVERASYFEEERPTHYNRWRIEKDRRVTEYRISNPSDLPVYGALNFDLAMTGGWIGDRWGAAGYHYYGHFHFVLKDAVKRRALYMVASKHDAHRNMLLLLADLILARKRRTLSAIVCGAIGHDTLYSKHDRRHEGQVLKDFCTSDPFVEAILIGRIRMREDVEYLLVPSRFPPDRFDRIARGKATPREIELLLGSETKPEAFNAFDSTIECVDPYKGKLLFLEIYEITAKLGPDLTRALCQKGQRIARIHEIARALGVDLFGKLFGYTGPELYANAKEFCDKHAIKLVEVDLYGAPSPCKFAREEEQPLPKPAEEERRDDTRREAVQPFWKNARLRD